MPETEKKATPDVAASLRNDLFENHGLPGFSSDLVWSTARLFAKDPLPKIEAKDVFDDSIRCMQSAPAVSRNIQVRLNAQGQVDLETLEASVTRQNLADWMRARFERRDRVLLFDEEHFEAPQDVFVALWRRADQHSRVRRCLDDGCVDLLNLAWNQPAEPWVADLLQLVMALRPQPCQQLLVRIALHHEFSQETVARGLDCLWLQAAAMYRPQSTQLAKTWPELLANPRYTTLAFQALAQDEEQGLAHLAQYYQMLPDTERPLLLREALRDLIDQGALFQMRRQAARFGAEPGLPQAIDAALRELGLPAIYHDLPADLPAKRTDRACNEMKISRIAWEH